MRDAEIRDITVRLVKRNGERDQRVRIGQWFVEPSVGRAGRTGRNSVGTVRPPPLDDIAWFNNDVGRNERVPDLIDQVRRGLILLAIIRRVVAVAVRIARVGDAVLVAIDVIK